MLDSAGLIKRTCSALCLKEGLERAARTVHRSRCMVPIKFRSFVRSIVTIFVTIGHPLEIGSVGFVGPIDPPNGVKKFPAV